MDWEYNDDRELQREKLEHAHSSVNYVTSEMDVLDAEFNAIVSLFNPGAVVSSLTVSEAIAKLRETNRGSDIITWLSQQKSTSKVSIGSLKYTFWARYKKLPICTPWNIKGYKMQGWVAVN